jgi:nickel-dependent lactate racemase
MKQLIAEAFRHPVNFPHISQVIYPGDRVVIAADAFVVRQPGLLADFVTEIVAVGLDANDVTVLMLEPEQKMYGQAFRDALPEEYRTAIRVAGHNPLDPQNLAILGVAKDDSPIMLNRVLVDADVVIPIARYEAATDMGYFGMHGAIYPRFADDETQKRFLFSGAKKNREKLLTSLIAEVDEIVFALGVMMTVQILVDSQGEILNVLVGDAKGIAKCISIPKPNENTR